MISPSVFSNASVKGGESTGGAEFDVVIFSLALEGDRFDLVVYVRELGERGRDRRTTRHFTAEPADAHVDRCIGWVLEHLDLQAMTQVLRAHFDRPGCRCKARDVLAGVHLTSCPEFRDQRNTEAINNQIRAAQAELERDPNWAFPK